MCRGRQDRFSGGRRVRRLEPSGLGVSEVAERVAQGRVNAAPAPPVRTLGEIIRANVLTWVNAIVGTLFVLVLMAGRPADGLFVGIILSNTSSPAVRWRRGKRCWPAPWPPATC